MLGNVHTKTSVIVNSNIYKKACQSFNNNREMRNSFTACPSSSFQCDITGLWVTCHHVHTDFYGWRDEEIKSTHYYARHKYDD